MIVGNATSRHLETSLTRLETYVDGFIILDDGSTDQTENICINQKKLLLYKKRRNTGFWQNETKIRQELWKMIETAQPKWVLIIDPDELLEDTIRHVLPDIIDQERFHAVHFPVNHFWGSEKHIRTDGEWNPHKNYELLLFRYFTDLEYHWPVNAGPCLRHPLEVLSYPSRYSHVRLFHYAWADCTNIRGRTTRIMASSPEELPKPLESHLLPWKPRLSLQTIYDET
jgi:glycosyltransferase involved in cell wall biosynthesis